MRPPSMTNLSPAAASIVQAFDDSYEINMFNVNWQEDCIAAALRAAADQICMKQPLGDTDADAGVFAAHRAISTSLLDIVDELEAP